MEKQIVLAITGASGFIYGEKMLELLYAAKVKVHLIVSDAAKLNCALEGSTDILKLSKKAYAIYAPSDIHAPIASGSFKTAGMIIAPCSVHTMSAISCGITDNLITRAADVTLKERRRLVLLFREAPLHSGHLKNMLNITEMGGIIYPPVPSFYASPESVEDIVYQTASRVLDLFDIDSDCYRWNGI